MINILPLVLVTLAEITEATAKSHRTNVKEPPARLKEQRNREELVQIIKSLNGVTEADNYERTKKQGENHKEQHKMVEVLKEIRQKEFDARTTQPKTGRRIHVIRNPEVLDRYVKMLRKDSSSCSDSDSSGEDDRRHGNEAIDVRRNAMFRIGASSEGDDNGILNDDSNKIAIFPQSMEYQVTPFKPRASTEESDQDRKNSNPPDKIKRFKIKSQADPDKKEASKDTDIEVKYEGEDNIKSGEKSNKKSESDEKVDSWQKPDKSKEQSDEKVDNDPWDRREERKHKNEEADIDKWDETNKKIEDNKSGEKDPWDRPKKRNKDVIRSEEKFENDDLDKPRKKKSRNNNDWYDEPKADKKNKRDNSDRDNTNKKDWDTSEKRFKKKDSNKNWDSQETNWKKQKKSNDFDDNVRKRTTKREKAIQDNEWTPSKIKDNNNWAKVGREWEKHNYDSEKHRNSWTNKKRDVAYEKPSYIAKVPEYQKHKSRGSFQGRTPIPFIGKRGIYDDK